MKSLLLRALPDRLLAPAQRLYHRRLVRRFQPAHLPVLRSLISPADTALDVGANLGWYTWLFSRLVGPHGHVGSVEPVPRTFAELSYHTRPLGNVARFNLALSDRDGSSVTMEIPHYETGGENYYQAAVVTDGRPPERYRRVAVPVASMDGLFGHLGHVAFVKIDVEGHEVAVVRGGLESLTRWRPALLIEAGGDPDDEASSAGAVIGMLADLRYRPYRFVHGRLSPRRPGESAVDYFFLTDAHRERLGPKALER